MIRFLNDEKKNRSPIRGVIGAGNTNFGEAFCLAGDVITARRSTVYRFEVFGTPDDVRIVHEGLETFWKQQPHETTPQATTAGAPWTITPSTPCSTSTERRNPVRRGPREAARRAYFLQHVNQNTVFFHSLEEKLRYLVEEGYYEAQTLEQYQPEFLPCISSAAFAHKFRFPTFLGAYKYYTSYTLTTRDGARYLERYEDRVVMVALSLARGNETFAMTLMAEILSGRFQPATPHFLNAGKTQRGELISCFLLRLEDNMESDRPWHQLGTATVQARWWRRSVADQHP